MARAIRATPGFSRQCARWLLRKLKLGNLVMERDSSALTGQALAACKLDRLPIGPKAEANGGRPTRSTIIPTHRYVEVHLWLSRGGIAQDHRGNPPVGLRS